MPDYFLPFPAGIYYFPISRITMYTRKLIIILKKSDSTVVLSVRLIVILLSNE